MSVTILTIPCLTDNYAFLIHDSDSQETVLVDAPEAAAIERTLGRQGWKLTHILLTHHHYDHVDGVNSLRKKTGAEVMGCHADAHRLPKLDFTFSPGQIFRIAGHSCEVIDVPGHTVGHVAFHFAGLNAVFTGDSLMALGCGRLFEGTPEQMWKSLSKIAALPEETVVYSGHEYTLSNGRFALTIEPENERLIERVKETEQAAKEKRPTVPSTLSIEKATNPFLRASIPSVKASLGMENASDSAVFAEIRAKKDQF